MTLPAEEFIRRFLIHVLPIGFHRIRYYVFLSNCHRARKLERCRELLSSGGPVILKPEIVSIAGTSGHTNALLVGIVLSYLSYVDTAISQQTKHPRVTFEENSGPATILPIDYTDEAIRIWKASAAQAGAPITPPAEVPPTS